MTVIKPMNPALSIPPRHRDLLTPPETIAKRLQQIVGVPFPLDFPLSAKARRNGSNVRKLVAQTLEQYTLPEASTQYTFLSEKSSRGSYKGIPRITRELIDTYIVTSGQSYNLQIWNRLPASDDPLIELEGENFLLNLDVRLVFVKIDIKTKTVESVVVLTPEYVDKHLGSFGKKTIKHQLLISAPKRAEICASKPPIYYSKDTPATYLISTNEFKKPTASFNKFPKDGDLLSNYVLLKHVAEPLIGSVIPDGETKNRGQALEALILDKIGYTRPKASLLEGAYPDIRNQLLEVKVQDTQTVDLGLYTPEFATPLLGLEKITTQDVRYLIALMNTENQKIDGFVLCPGSALGSKFTYVDGVNGKFQRTIPMSFFEKYRGQSVFNPPQEKRFQF